MGLTNAIFSPLFFELVNNSQDLIEANPQLQISKPFSEYNLCYVDHFIILNLLLRFRYC